MLVTLLGIVTLVILAQLKNALSPILFTVDGITTLPPAPLYSVRTPLVMTNPFVGFDEDFVTFAANAGTQNRDSAMKATSTTLTVFLSFLLIVIIEPPVAILLFFTY
jgi:hypothetical protein